PTRRAATPTEARRRRGARARGVWRSSSFADQPATHGGRRELARQPVREESEAADRHRLELREAEAALAHEALEAADGHPVEATFDLAEARRAVRLEVRAPAHERPLREDQVRPGEDGEEVPAERVIPRRPERRDDRAALLQEAAHDPQHARRVVEVLEGIYGEDHVRALVRLCEEGAAVSDARARRGLPRLLQRLLAYVEADDPPRPAQRGLDRLRP